MVIVKNVRAIQLANGFVPLENRYAVVEYVREEFTKVDETDFFELYSQAGTSAPSVLLASEP